MAQPGRSSFPGKAAGQRLPLGKGCVLPGLQCGGDQDVPAQCQNTCLWLSLLAEEASPGSSGRGRSEPAWPTAASPARCLAMFGALCHLQHTTSAFHPNNHGRYQKSNGKRGSQSLILASIFFLCFSVLGWPGQVDKLLKKGKYHFNLFLQLIMANHRKADSNSRLAIALWSSHCYRRNFKSHTPQIP